MNHRIQLFQPLLAGLLTTMITAVTLAGCHRANDIIRVNESNNQQMNAELQALLADAGVTSPSALQGHTDEQVALGEALFFDKILSGNQNISCATCHHPVAATGDALPLPLGEGGTGVGATRQQGTSRIIPRNAPAVFNAEMNEVTTMFWDSRVSRDPVTGELTTPEPALNTATPPSPEIAALLDSALAAQAMFPVTSHDEMRGLPGSNLIADAADNLGVWSLLMERLVGTNDGTVGGIQGYRDLFDAAFPSITNYDDYNFGHAAKAIAAYEARTYTALNTPFDRYLQGDMTAMSDDAKRGAILFFGSARCANCHNGPMLSDFQHHGIAAPQLGPGKDVNGDDKGLAVVTGLIDDEYKFRTPSLRNVSLTGPWTHAGAYTSLEAVVRHHLDAATSLTNYDASQLPALYQSEVDTDPTRRDARIAAISPLLEQVTLTDEEVNQIVAFLHCLTDQDSVNLLDKIPDSVPSGLPVPD